jgi:hypothetical protein
MVEADHFERQSISTEPVIYWIDPALDPESGLSEKWVSPRHTHQNLPLEKNLKKSKKFAKNKDDRTHTERVKKQQKKRPKVTPLLSWLVVEHTKLKCVSACVNLCSVFISVLISNFFEFLNFFPAADFGGSVMDWPSALCPLDNGVRMKWNHGSDKEINVSEKITPVMVVCIEIHGNWSFIFPHSGRFTFAGDEEISAAALTKSGRLGMYADQLKVGKFISLPFRFNVLGFYDPQGQPFHFLCRPVSQLPWQQPLAQRLYSGQLVSVLRMAKWRHGFHA